MGEWRKYKLADVGRIVTGKTPPTSNPEFYSGEIPFVTPTDMDGRRTIDHTVRSLSELGAENVRSSCIHERAVVVSCIGSNMGKAALVSGPFVSNQQINAVVVSAEFDRLFIYYNLSARKAEILDKASGAAQPIMNKTAFGNLVLRAPNLGLQQTISGVLNALDDKIELNRRMNETLEAMARAIFKDWFVDFGPTRAKAEGRAPYLAPELWDLFPDSLDDQEKPEGWEIRKLEAILKLNYGKSLPARKRTPGNVAVYGSGGIAGTHDVALIEGPAVIVGRKGTVGSLYWEDDSAFPIDTVFYVVPRIGSVLFAYHLLATLPLREMNTDAAVPGLNRNNAYRLEFPLPSFELISAFESISGALWKRRAKNLVEAKTLTQTRDLLLPKLMSGEIRLGEAEKSMEVEI